MTDRKVAGAKQQCSGTWDDDTVYLPVVEGVMVPVEQTVTAVRPGLGHVLMVDDDEALGRVGRRLLERLGYQVTNFTSGRDALTALRADPQRYDVVLTDQQMPGMGGVEVAQAIVAIRPDLPIVLVSGSVEHSAEVLAAVGIRYVMEKPFTGVSLGKVLEQALQRG